ncbi:MAG: dihydroorotate dehydrogenase-like protein [Bacteroidetes bacterium]|nr:dihydroorotate dehydrogenase-like protein [Bacteroidota bacterium]
MLSKPDLSTDYLGLKLKSPIVPSASPLSESVHMIRKMEDQGAGAVVMHSLFEEQILHEGHRLDHYLDYGADTFAEALSYFPKAESYHVGPERYLDHIRRAREAVDIPVIASLNGISNGGWIDYAEYMQEAGASALELNIYYVPTNPAMSGADVERRYVDIVRSVKSRISIPLAVKIGPHFSSIGNMVQQLSDAGADAVVMFNRFYQPDVDLDKLEVAPHLVLSAPNEMRLPLRWVAILYGRVPIDFAITSGVHTYDSVLKCLMVGANVTMMASELLVHGVERIRQVLDSISEWMTEREYESIKQMRGSMSQLSVREPSAFERANYMKELQSWSAQNFVYGV